MLSNFLFSKPKNVGNAKCRPTIDRVSTNYWPIHRSSIDQLSTNYRRSVGEKSAKCRWTKSYIGRDTSGTTIDRVSIHYRPTIDRLRPLYRPSVDQVSTEYRPSVDRVSTECRPSVDRVWTDYRPSVDRLSTECRPLYRLLYRPLYRPISQPTLPTVNKIPKFKQKNYWSSWVFAYHEVLQGSQ